MWLDRELKIRAPELGSDWLNSVHLTMRGLRGHVVLVDFWDYTCVNCIRTLPYLREWHHRYHDKGLTIIGVHAPEFSFARSREKVAHAVKEFGLEYPILLDNDFEMWRAYANRYWPAKYLVDKGGYLRYYHFGEGSYGETEEAIQRLLKEINPQLVPPPLMEPVRDADRPGTVCYRVTPELYTGFARGRLGNHGGYVRNQVHIYNADSNHLPDLAYLEGAWLANEESIEARPTAENPSRLSLTYTAAEVNLVMRPPDSDQGIIALRQDGHPLAAEDAGEDVTYEGGAAVIHVRQPRMYRLIKNKNFQEHALELSAITPGLKAFAFTFVSRACE